MKKVLIIAHIFNIVDIEFVNNFIQFLKERNSQVFSSIDFNNKSFTKQKPEEIIENNFDLIFLINTERHKSYFKGLAKICIVNTHRFFSLWTPESTLTFWSYGDINSNNIINSKNHLSIPYSKINDIKSIEENQEFDYFFIFKENTVLLKVLLFINLLHNKKIALFCSFKDFQKKLFNVNVTFINDNNFEETLISAKTVIGEGELIAKAVLLKKPAIILGNNGYGGLLTEKNIISQYHQNFSGRIGGVINEMIPLNLLQLDFETLTNVDIEVIRRTKEILEQEIEKEKSQLQKKIESIIFIDKNNLSIHLVKNPDYSYFLISSLNEYIVIHSTTNKLLYQIPIEEFNLIEEFSMPISVDSLIAKIKNQKLSKQRLKSVIEKLVKYNLLQYAI